MDEREAVAIMKKNAAEWGAHGAEKVIAAGRYDWLMSMPPVELINTVGQACRAHLEDYLQAQFGSFDATIPEAMYEVWGSQWLPAFYGVMDDYDARRRAEEETAILEMRADLRDELTASGVEEFAEFLVLPDGTMIEVPPPPERSARPRGHG